MFAEKLFWLPWFYSTVLISSIVCVFFRAACQSCRHPQPWMASFIVRVSWPGRLFCWVWLLCDILWFLNTPHKIYYSPVQLELQNVSPPVYIHLYCFIPRISHFVLCVHKFASLSPLTRSSLPSVCPPQVWSLIYGSWFAARAEKGVASLHSDRFGFQTDASTALVRGGTTVGPPGPQLKVLPVYQRRSVCVRTVGVAATTWVYI